MDDVCAFCYESALFTEMYNFNCEYYFKGKFRVCFQYLQSAVSEAHA